MRVFYLDTSAAMKLLRREPETPALVEWFQSLEGTAHRTVSSELIRTELLLNAPRYDVSVANVRQLVGSLSLLAVTSALCETAGQFSQLQLRSLDALHLASALSLIEVLDAVVTYDQRMVQAAGELGIVAIGPS